MIVILASHREAEGIARDRGLTRREWLPGATVRSLRGLRGPIETIMSPDWYDANPKRGAEIVDEIARINARYPKPTEADRD